MVHIDARHVDRRAGAAPAGFLGTVNTCRRRLSFLGQSVPPGVGLSAKIPLDGGILEALARHLVLHHVFEVVLDSVEDATVINIELRPIALGDGAAEVVEQGLAFINGLDAAFVEV